MSQLSRIFLFTGSVDYFFGQLGAACRHPVVLVNELRLFLVIEQRFEQRIAFIALHAGDVFRHRPIDSDLETFGTLIKSEITKWTEVIRVTNVKADYHN